MTPPADLAPGHGARSRHVPDHRELFQESLRLGALGFGGGVSVLASIERLTVQRKKWLTAREFANMATVAQMLPGGAAANALACIGLRFHGVRGAALAYVGFVLPGAASILALAWVYVRFGAVPRADAFLSGLNAAVVGIIGSIALRMLRSGVSRPWQMAITGFALLLSLVGGSGSLEIAMLGIAAGLIWDLGIERARLLRFRPRRWRAAPPIALPEEGRQLVRRAGQDAVEPGPPPTPPPARGAPMLLAMSVGPGLSALLIGLLPLALVFFRTGLGAYGGGFAIIPSLHAEMLGRGWLTERQFADAVAVGKLTPGPVLLMATFIGYLQSGLAGAAVATASILAAPFALVVLLATWLDRVRSKRWMRAALRGLTPAVVGLMLASALTLGQSIHTTIGITIATTVGLTLIRFEDVNPVALLAAGGLSRVVLLAALGH